MIGCNPALTLYVLWRVSAVLEAVTRKSFDGLVSGGFSRFGHTHAVYGQLWLCRSKFPVNNSMRSFA